MSPPRWPLRLLRALLPPGSRDAILGDLTEEFRVRVRSEGPARAHWWIWSQTAKAVLPAVRLRFRSGTRRGRDRGIPWGRNVRHSLRGIRARPLHAAVIVLTFALGIGLNSSLLSIASQLMLAPLPYGDSERLVVPWPGHALPGDLVQELHEGSTRFEDVAVHWDVAAAEYFDPGRPGATSIGYTVGRVSRNFLDLFEVRPALGRGFVDADVPPREQWRHPGKVILTWEAWTGLFGADSTVVGTSVQNGAHTTEIVGVMPPEATPLARGNDGWSVVAFMDQLAGNLQWRFETFARLAPGVSVEDAAAELEGRLTAARERRDEPVLARWTSRPEFGPVGAAVEEQTLVRMDRYLAGNIQGGLALLVVAGLGTLGIALVNASSLALQRSVERQREAALRLVLGARKRDLVSLVLTEQLLLALAAGAVAVGVAAFTITGVGTILPQGLPRVFVEGVGTHTVFWAAAGSLLCAMMSTSLAAVPFLSGESAGESRALGLEGGRTTTATRRSLGGLLVFQVALVTVLMIGAGILVRTVQQLRSVDPGFAWSQVALLTPQANGIWQRAPEEPPGRVMEDYFERVRTELERLDFVTGVAQGAVPMTASFSSAWDVVGGRTPGGRSDLQATWRVVGVGDYFKALGVELITGRPLGPEDADVRPGDPQTVLVNDRMSQGLWPGQDPLGRHFTLSYGERFMTFRVAGVVRSFRFQSLDRPSGPMFWTRMGGRSLASLPLFVRVSGDPAVLMPRLREVFHSVDPRVPLISAAPLGKTLDASIADRRSVLLLLAGLAATGLVLGVLGIYGVTTLSTARRSREIGIRVALGAGNARVLRLVVGQGMRWVLGGLVLGLGAAALASPLLSEMLYQVDSRDPLTFIAVPGVLLTSAVIASLLPAIRATRLDPSVTLREE